MTVAELETKYTNLIKSLIAETEEATAVRLLSLLRPAAKPPKRSKVDMTCRAPKCKQRSKGPRFRFMCENHLKPKVVKPLKVKPPKVKPPKVNGEATTEK